MRDFAELLNVVTHSRPDTNGQLYSSARRYSSGEHPKSLAICVGPFHNNYSEALRLVEFVEAYKLLGAEHFYFYNKSTTPAVDKVAQYYQDMNIASVQKWNFDGEFWFSCSLAQQKKNTN